MKHDEVRCSKMKHDGQVREQLRELREQVACKRSRRCWTVDETAEDGAQDGVVAGAAALAAAEVAKAESPVGASVGTKRRRCREMLLEAASDLQAAIPPHETVSVIDNQSD